MEHLVEQRGAALLELGWARVSGARARELRERVASERVLQALDAAEPAVSGTSGAGGMYTASGPARSPAVPVKLVELTWDTASWNTAFRGVLHRRHCPSRRLAPSAYRVATADIL